MHFLYKIKYFPGWIDSRDSDNETQLISVRRYGLGVGVTGWGLALRAKGDVDLQQVDPGIFILS